LDGRVLEELGVGREFERGVQHAHFGDVRVRRHFLDVGIQDGDVAGQVAGVGDGRRLQDLGLEGLEFGQAAAFLQRLGAEGRIRGSEAEDLRPALLGFVEVAAGFQQAGVFDVGGQETGEILVDLVQEPQGARIVRELGGGDGFGQQALGFRNDGVGRGHGRQFDQDGVGVGRRKIGLFEHLGDLRRRIGGGRGRAVGGARFGAGHHDDGFVGRRRGVLAVLRLLFRFEGGADFRGAGLVRRFGFRPDEADGPIDEKRQQAHFGGKDGDGQEAGEGLQDAGAWTQPLVGRDDVLKLDAGLADFQHVLVGEPDGVEHGAAVAQDGVFRRQTGKENAGSALFEAGMARLERRVVRQQQVAFGMVAHQGDGLAHHEALARVATG